MIRAAAHSDDHVIAFAFDAEPYFRQASDRALAELEACGFGGDYPADYVLLHFEGEQDHPAARLMRYLYAREGVGFECHVDPEQAHGWIECNRPLLAQLLAEADQA